jgi:two-component system alkaline phosphatase synthesis response regulator PhoP
MARVLIVDDEPDILLMLRVNLEAHGYETALAADGETALQRVTSDRFDLMLLDVMMPVMDGWGVLEHLAGHDDPPRVIVVSAKSSDNDITRAISAGAVDYLPKPFSPSARRVLVEQVLAYDDDGVVAHRRARLGAAGSPASSS